MQNNLYRISRILYSFTFFGINYTTSEHVTKSFMMAKYSERVPQQLFDNENHYLGRPADLTDKIVNRRLTLLKDIPHFIGKEYELLDIGCGNGASMLLLASQMKYCQGIDINPDNETEFKQYKKALSVDNCNFQILDIDKDSLSKQYDRIISFEVIEHLCCEDSLKFYFNTLKDDGILAISVPNRWWIFETHGATLPFLPWNRVPFFSWLPTKIHDRYANARIYSTKRISKLLVKHGFEIQNMQYIMAPMDVLPKGKFKDFIVKYFFNKHTTKLPFKSTSIFVVATKKKVL